MLLEAERRQGRRMDQPVMPAGAALDQDEIAGGQVANPSSVERDHMRLCSPIVHGMRTPPEPIVARLYAVTEHWFER
jgi:hypothetical protein